MGKIVGLILFAMVIVGVSSTTFANRDLEGKIVEFSRVSDSEKRLECFDAIANSQSEEKAENGNTDWAVKQDKSEMDDSKRVFITKYSTNQISNPLRKTFNPALMIRCMDKKTELFIAYYYFIGNENMNIETRVDNEKSKKEIWLSSNDGRMAFSPNPIKFIKSMYGKKIY